MILDCIIENAFDNFFMWIPLSKSNGQSFWSMGKKNYESNDKLVHQITRRYVNMCKIVYTIKNWLLLKLFISIFLRFTNCATYWVLVGIRIFNSDFRVKDPDPDSRIRILGSGFPGPEHWIFNDKISLQHFTLLPRGRNFLPNFVTLQSQLDKV
jgi:hypothetical protein